MGFGGSCSRGAGWVMLTVQDLGVSIISSRQNRESDLDPRVARMGGESPCDSWYYPGLKIGRREHEPLKRNR